MQLLKIYSSSKRVYPTIISTKSSVPRNVHCVYFQNQFPYSDVLQPSIAAIQKSTKMLFFSYLQYGNFMFLSVHVYFESGTVYSYNYQGGIHLANQQYNNCIRTEEGYCSIAYTSSSFQVLVQVQCIKCRLPKTAI